MQTQQPDYLSETVPLLEHGARVVLPGIAQESATLSIPETARVLGISKTLAYEAALRGEIPTIKIGTRRLVPREALLRLLQAV